MIKTIPNFEDYAITKDGCIWSKRRYKWLCTHFDKDGYVKISFLKSGRHQTKAIHRLVLETYIGPCPRGMQCRHINSNPTDNRLSNLCWDTLKNNQADRIKYSTAPGLKTKGENHYQAKLKEKDVRMIIYMWNTGLFMQKEIAKVYNISRSAIEQIVTKRTWKHIWR